LSVEVYVDQAAGLWAELNADVLWIAIEELLGTSVRFTPPLTFGPLGPAGNWDRPPPAFFIRAGDIDGTHRLALRLREIHDDVVLGTFAKVRRAFPPAARAVLEHARASLRPVKGERKKERESLGLAWAGVDDGPVTTAGG
jgi:hypothetical protein